MRIYVHTHGCRLNAAESRTLVETLEAAGCEIAYAMDQSVDVAVVNSCAVTDQAESKCKQTIRQIVRAQPDVALIITGCLAEKNPQAILNCHHRILVLGNSEKHRVVDHIRALDLRKNFSEIVQNSLGNSNFEIPCALRRPYRERYNLKIQEGCNFFCSYCIIPQLRGRARSRDFENLVKDAAIHGKRGVKEIVLTGVNIGTYENNAKNLADVIAALNEIPEIQRIRLSSIELKTIPDAVLEQMADNNNKLVKYLHLPIQSGSDRILQLMRRRYTIAEAKNYLEQVAKRIPGIGLGMDLIVGFPSETEKDFTCSADLIQNSPLQYAHVFSFSPREETVANLMEDRFIEPKEIERRSKILRALGQKKHGQFLELQLGKVETVLFENKEKFGFPGLTESYIRVLVKNYPMDLTNQIKKVRLTKNCTTHMLGEIVGD
ncbi:MAG: tRNA (N(6)-L-threonylcarbamoyladenosine(37)-C(2))-methylthiotransferase MtaB [Holosporaceae bacterium]|jgi:threonylcarbamoyladenosine tRNA methylthiotransferase MtaB|nr:tRNA (N(6)-L-threonylcarbamoyladenosine(37)-C(2))-methylthiotransferase MtaB [Holosporaceae bacterium]